MKHLFSLLVLISSINTIYSQNRIIQGKVIDDMDLQPIIGVQIIVNDSIEVGVTGIDGGFQFETPLPIDKLSFKYIGMENADLKLSDNCNHIELIMISMPHYDFMSFRKINKIRRKLYKKLPILHKKAYDRCIFQSSDICYMQVFSKIR